MTTRTIAAVCSLSAVALIAACASPGGSTAHPPSTVAADEHAAHQAQAGAAVPMAEMEPRMKAMREMHQKMTNARTPEERQALMADHMRAMQDGMRMMQGMGAMGGMPGIGSRAGVGGTTFMTDAKGMPADMASRHRTMEQHMQMMQMMMDMMADRMPPVAAKP